MRDADVTSALVEAAVCAARRRRFAVAPDLLKEASLQRTKYTLVSCWIREGYDVGPALRHELAVKVEQASRYAAIAADLEQSGHDAVAVKGARLAALYPRDVLRQAYDVDILVPSHDAAWACAKRLLDDGFSVWGMGAVDAGDAVRLMLELRRRTGEPFHAPIDKVEIATVAFVGDQGTGVLPSVVPPAGLDARDLAFQLLQLVEERLQRPFSGRDVLDAALALTAADDATMSRLVAALSETGMWREWLELGALLGRAGVLSERASERAKALRREANGAGDARRRLRRVRSTAGRGGQALLAERSLARLGARPRAVSLRRGATGAVPARALLAAGGRVCAAWLSADRSAELSLEEDGAVLVARTPLGSFALGHELVVDRYAEANGG